MAAIVISVKATIPSQPRIKRGTSGLLLYLFLIQPRRISSDLKEAPSSGGMTAGPRLSNGEVNAPARTGVQGVFVLRPTGAQGNLWKTEGALSAVALFEKAPTERCPSPAVSSVHWAAGQSLRVLVETPSGPSAPSGAKCVAVAFSTCSRRLTDLTGERVCSLRSLIGQNHRLISDDHLSFYGVQTAPITPKALWCGSRTDLISSQQNGCRETATWLSQAGVSVPASIH